MRPAVAAGVSILAVATLVSSVRLLAQLPGPTCVQGRSPSQLFPFEGLAEVENVNQVTVFLDAAARTSPYFSASRVQDALGAWNQGCPDPAGSESVPQFILDAVNNAPPDRVAYNEQTGQIVDRNSLTYQNWSQSVSIAYRPGAAVPFDESRSAYTPARWDPIRNEIIFYDLVPQGVNLDVPIVTQGMLRHINWNSPYGILVAKHELGHALGLEEDRAGDCSGAHGVMKYPLTQNDIGLSVDPYCNFINHANRFDPCNLNPGDSELSPSETHPCEDATPNAPVSGSGGGDLACLDSPWLCDPDGVPRWERPQQRVCVWYSASVRVEDIESIVVTWETWYECGVPAAQGGDWLQDDTHVAPLVSIQAPHDDEEVSGIVTIEGWAMDLRQPVLLEVAIDGIEIPWISLITGLNSDRACDPALGGSSIFGCRHNSRFRGTIDSTAFPNGSHVLQVSATNPDQFAAVAEATVVVANCLDSEPPSIAVTGPSSGSSVQGNVTMTAAAGDNGQIDRVEFYIDGQYLVTDSQAPYSKTWNTVGYPNGAHAVSAKAYDSCGNEGVSASVPVTVYNPPANAPPQLNVDGPAENGTVTSRYLNLWGWATDSGGVPTLTFALDGQPKTLTWARGARPDVCSAIPIGDPNCPNVGWSATMDLYGVAAGYHTLRVTAVDNLGLSADLDRTFRIVNSAPSAAVGSPAYGRTVSGSRVTVAGWATDSDGIESVRLEVNGSPVTVLEPWTRIPWEGVCSAGSTIDPDCPNVGFKVAFDSRGFTDGNKSLRVIARDLRGVDYSINHSIRIRNNPAGTKTTKQATADTHVRSSSPSTVYGASSPIYLRYVDGDYRHGFVKFNLQGMTGQVVAARLKIRPYSSTAPKINVWKITSGTWNEATFNWNGLGAMTWALHDSFWDLPTGAADTIDVTDMVSLGGELTIGLSAESSSLIYFYSREYGTSSYRPVLEVWTQ